jgi:hypothetical protein
MKQNIGLRSADLAFFLPLKNNVVNFETSGFDHRIDKRERYRGLTGRYFAL